MESILSCHGHKCYQTILFLSFYHSCRCCFHMVVLASHQRAERVEGCRTARRPHQRLNPQRRWHATRDPQSDPQSDDRPIATQPSTPSQTWPASSLPFHNRTTSTTQRASGYISFCQQYPRLRFAVFVDSFGQSPPSPDLSLRRDERVTCLVGGLPTSALGCRLQLTWQSAGRSPAISWN